MKGAFLSLIRCAVVFCFALSHITIALSRGQEWITTTAPFTNWSSLACSSDGTRIVACVNGGGIYVSPDFVVTWNKSSATNANWSTITCSSDGSRIIAGAGAGSIWVSVDFGTNWHQTTAPAAQWTSVASSEDGMVIVAASTGKVYISTNAGGSWDAVAALGERKWNRVTISSDGTKIALSASGQDAALAVSSNRGATWGGGIAMVAVAASKDASRLYAASGSVYHSTDFGQSWGGGNLPWAHWNLIVCSSDGSRLMTLGNDPGNPLYASADGGVNWTHIEAPPRLWKDVAMSADGSKFVALASGDGIYTWQPSKAVITVQPESQTILAGADAMLNVGVGFGIGPFYYQWRFNGVDLPGETNQVLKLSNLTSSRAGDYSVVIRNDFGSTPSRNAVITVQPAIITAQPNPIEQTVPGGVEISFNVTALSMIPLSYQWQHDGTNIIDATNSVLILRHVSLSDNGSYTVVLTNSYGSVASKPASLTVVPAFIATLGRDSSTTDAILNGEVTPGFNDTVAWFEWGSTTNLGLRTPLIRLPQTTNSIRISALVTNLVPYRDYYFHAVASNNLGKVVGFYGQFDSYPFRATPRFVRIAAPQVPWTSIACSGNGARVIASAHNYYWDNTFGPRTLPGSLIYISTNFGLTWRGTSSPSTNWGHVAMSSDATKLFAAAGVYAGADTAGPIYASRDSGSTWQQVADSRFWRDLACSGDGSTVLASSDFVFVSQDFGATWQQPSMPRGIWRSAAMSKDGTKMAVINYSGFWRDPSTMWTSLDSGTTWKAVSSGKSLKLVSSGDGSKIFATGDGVLGSAAISTDWGTTWQPIFPTPLDRIACAATTFDGTKWFISTIRGIICTADSFASRGATDDPTIEPLSIACSSDARSVYAIDGRGSMFVWQETTAHLNMNLGTEGPFVSWPSYRLSSKLQENSTLNPTEWTDGTDQPALTNRMFRFSPRPKTDKTFYRLKAP